MEKEMRGKTGGQSTPGAGAKSYPWEDRALKAAAQLMGEELLPLLGVEGRVERIKKGFGLLEKEREHLDEDELYERYGL